MSKIYNLYNRLSGLYSVFADHWPLTTDHYPDHSPLATNKGFTLVELLIAMAIASVVGMAGVSLFSSSNWAYKVNEDVAEAQQNARVAMERLSKDIRAAGFGLPEPLISLTFTNLPSTFVGQSGGNITLTSPITVTTSGGAGAPDSLTILGIGYEAGQLSGTNGTGQAFICYARTTTEEKLIDATKVVPNRRYISVGGTLFVTLNTVSTATGACNGAGTAMLPLALPATLDRTYQAGTVVYIIQAVQYTIANDLTGCSATNPCLTSNDTTALREAGRQVLAENIEDIQFAYGLDGTIPPGYMKDGKIDYGVSYETADFSNDPPDDSTIIAVRASMVGKTRNQDPKGATGFKRPALEDRAESAGDGYRRRMLTKVIKLRNLRL